jgi:micrococcal nuclease
MNKYFYKIAVSLFLLLVIPSLCHAWLGEVVHVADGDTITVLRDGKKIKVRLYGIDTPETKQWYSQNAKAFTSSQVMGKTVDVQEIAC